MNIEQIPIQVLPPMTSSNIYALLTVDSNSYLYPELVKAVKRHLPSTTQIVHNTQELTSVVGDADISKAKVFQYGEYEDLDFDRLNSDLNYLGCSFVYRKGLIRKHYLSNTIALYTAKNPDSILKNAFPEAFNIEVDYAEFLDDSLDEAYELRLELEANAEKPSGERNTWILKPSMSDRGQGIRLFQTIPGLQKIFDEFEEDNDDGECEDEDENAPTMSLAEAMAAHSLKNNNDNDNDDNDDDEENNHKIITSQLRHFIVQQYVGDTLLLPAYNNRKFHIRAYVLCVGVLKVYVYKNMLALFALSPYVDPNQTTAQSSGSTNSNGNESSGEDSEEALEGEEIPMQGHLTNTCLQGERKDDKSVNLFFELEGLSDTQKDQIYSELCQVTGELFNAAVNGGSINFQPLPNAFEIYGLDFLVTEDLHVKLLEVNAYPDFKQTGDKLVNVITELFDQTVETAVKPYFEKSESVASKDMTLVYNKQVSGGW